MQRKFTVPFALTLTVILIIALTASVVADTIGVDFETYSLGNINGQDGWSKTGPFDVAVVTNIYGFGTFDTKSLRISNAITSGSFGDQTFAKPLTDAVGETAATAGPFSVGTRQTHFEIQFDIASTLPTMQTGMVISVSPDRGDGSRMSYLRFEDASGGINVFFDDVQQTVPCTPASCASFVETQVGTNLSRTTPHTIKLTMDTLDGPGNDVVKVFIDGILVHTGTSWEDYYRYDPEAAPESTPRIVKTVIFRVAGPAMPANNGNGFLLDNVTLSSCSGVVTNLNTSETFCSIQAAIDDPDTLNGHTITVGPGTYAEDITVNKSLDIRGPNYGISPNTGVRGPEAVVVPATPAIATGEIFHVEASNVSIDGFTIDGDNTALTSGFSSTNGADIDAAEGVTVYVDNVNNLTVSNNIIQNLSYFGVTIFGGSYSAPATTGHLVDDNLFKDFGTYDNNSTIEKWGGGVLLYNNQYTRVIDNVMNNVRLGVQTGNFSQANPGAATYQEIDGNTMQVRRVGVFHNLQYGPTSSYTLSNNTITGLANVNELGVRGILLSSLSVASTSQNNVINLSGVTAPSSGYEVWNVKNTAPATITGGSVSGVDIGLFLNNYEGYNSNAADGAHASVSGLSITPNAGGTGIRVLDSPSSTHANVQLAIGTGVTVNGGANGLVVENTNASVTSTSDLALSGQTGNYIELVNNAVDIDATGVSFDGQTGATATLAQNFAIEDKVVHKVDNSSLGLVRVKAGEIFVTPSSGSVQRGVDAASAGNTVNVAAGTYVAPANIPISVMLKGAQYGVAVSGRTAGDASESTIQGLVTVDASNVEIDGFTLTNPGQTYAVDVDNTPSHSDITIAHNIVDNVGDVGLGSNVHSVIVSDGADSVTIAHNRFNNIKAGAKSVSAVGILQSTSIDQSTGLVIEDNTFSDIASATKGAYGVILNNGAGVPGAQIIDNTFSGLNGGWTHALGLEGPTPYAVVTGNVFSGLTVNSGSDNIAVFLEDNPNGGTVNAQCNQFNSTTFYGVAIAAGDVTTYNYITSAENNWWNNASGPYDPVSNPGGTGALVGVNVDYDPWLTTNVGCVANIDNWQNQTTMAYDDLQGSLDDADPGDEIKFVGTGPVAGGATSNKSGVTINLNGGTFGPGSPFLTVNSADFTVVGPGTLDGGGSGDPAILVVTGGDNFILNGVEVTDWADGVEVANSVTSFKLVNNWIHLNSDAGLQINSGVTLGGVVTIQGNLFKVNGGNGVQNDSGNTVNATYNSWGDVGGPASGDGVSGLVTDTPYTFSEVFVDVDPNTAATVRNVTESVPFNVAVKVDAKGLYAVQYKLTYDPNFLTLQDSDGMIPGVQVVNGPFKGTGACTQTITVGSVSVYCTRFQPDANVDAVETISTLTFIADGVSLTGNGTWNTFLDLSVAGNDLSSAARDGIKVFVNNGGFDSPSATPGRTITDSPDDGEIIITGIARFTGFVDVQGRPNDSGAVVQVYNQLATSGATLLASGTSVSSGSYTTNYIPSNLLTVGTTYYFQIDRALYLPTTVKYPSLVATWADMATLTTRQLTPLSMAVLLGGDATDNDKVDINDSTCIGNQYGIGVAACGAPNPPTSSSDVNGDGTTNIFDLVLMGGNFYLDASPWTP